jgi:alkanesulfonate monooxygenase SsuD/methylene tetrahydromethanopterin reductase-like flavin-dependent oxidoreductase (luciferase family)
MVAQYADGSNFFGDLERVKHLLGVLEGHCERFGRDMAEITKTRMGTLFIGETHDAANAKVDAAIAAGADEQRVRAMAFVGDPGEVSAQVQELLDAGLDGVTLSLPDVHDLETVALAGETLGAMIGTRTA